MSCPSTSPGGSWTGCRCGPGSSSMSGSSAGRDGHVPTRSRCRWLPMEHTLRITAKALGEGSSRLAYLRPGTRVLFEGPYGRLSSRARTQRKIVLAGAGVGITPCARWPRGSSTPQVRRYCCSATPRSPCLPASSRSSPPRRVCRLFSCQAHGVRRPRFWARRQAVCPELTGLRRWIPDLAERDVFVCGPSAWTDGVERLALAAGVPGGRIHSESFGW